MEKHNNQINGLIPLTLFVLVLFLDVRSCFTKKENKYVIPKSASAKSVKLVETDSVEEDVDTTEDEESEYSLYHKPSFYTEPIRTKKKRRSGKRYRNKR